MTTMPRTGALATLCAPGVSVSVRAIRGTAWTVGAYGAESALRLASNFILAQLLAPETFGLLTIAMLVQQSLNMFSDLGVGVSIVRHRSGDDAAYLNTAWTLQAIRGAMIWLIACVLTWPMAAAYQQPILLAIIPVTSLVALIQGLQSTRVYTSQRQLDLSRITMLRLGETILRFVVTIGWAMVDPSVWAIVGGGLIAASAQMLATHFVLRGVPNRPAWDREAARDLISFGRWVFISSALTFFAMQSDKLLLGRISDLHVLGVYAVAMPFAKLPHEVGCLLASTVLLPALASRARESHAQMQATFEEARGIILPASLAATIGVALVAPWFFRLYKSGYQDAVWLAPMLSVCLWFAVLQTISDRALPAIGVARPLAVANAAALVTTVIGCIVGYAQAGLFGFVVGVGLGFGAGYTVIAIALARQGLPVLVRDLRYTLVLVAGLAVAFGPMHLGGGTPAWQLLPAMAVLLLSACLMGAAAISVNRIRVILVSRGRAA